MSCAGSTAHPFSVCTPKQVSWFAMLLSSAVFAMAHRELLAAFICGVVYAGFYRRHGQLRYVVAAHAVTNLALGIYIVMSGRWEFW
jgi:CAAX prenyl protease-like protein